MKRLNSPMSRFYRCGKLMRPSLEGGIGSPAAGVEARGECHRSKWVLGFDSEPRGVSGVLGVASHPSFRRGFRRGKQAQLPPAQPPEGKKSGSTTGGAPGENTGGGSTVETGAEAETLRNQPFNLNQRQPVPPDFGWLISAGPSSWLSSSRRPGYFAGDRVPASHRARPPGPPVIERSAR